MLLVIAVENGECFRFFDVPGMSSSLSATKTQNPDSSPLDAVGNGKDRTDLNGVFLDYDR